jgi:hypothetical protein
MFGNTAFAVTPFSAFYGGEAFRVSVSEDIGVIAEAQSVLAQLPVSLIETMSIADTESSTLTAIWTVIDTTQTPPDPNWQTIVNP